MALTAADFAAFFCAIHGHDPFPWQQRLVEQLASNSRWPDVLDLPTGSGKTAALDVAVFHLALQANSPQRCAALRIVLVVDRRLVVDDANRRAQRIAAAVRDPSRCPEAGRGVVTEVARRLQRLAGCDEAPLVAERLRGGVPLEHDWARTPAATDHPVFHRRPGGFPAPVPRLRRLESDEAGARRPAGRGQPDPAQ